MSSWRDSTPQAVPRGRALSHDGAVSTLIHFTATWADGICAPHRSLVRESANLLGCELVERDIDKHPEDARHYGVLNVPAVAVMDHPEGDSVMGARLADDLVALLKPRIA